MERNISELWVLHPWVHTVHPSRIFFGLTSKPLGGEKKLGEVSMRNSQFFLLMNNCFSQGDHHIHAKDKNPRASNPLDLNQGTKLN